MKKFTFKITKPNGYAFRKTIKSQSVLYAWDQVEREHPDCIVDYQQTPWLLWIMAGFATGNILAAIILYIYLHYWF